MGRHTVALGLQAAEVDHTLQIVCGVGEVLRGPPLAIGEPLASIHLMDEVVGSVGIPECRPEGVRLFEITGVDLDLARPRPRRHPVGISGQHTHVVPPSEQPWHQSAANVPRRAGDQNAHQLSPGAYRSTYASTGSLRAVLSDDM